MINSLFRYAWLSALTIFAHSSLSFSQNLQFRKVPTEKSGVHFNNQIQDNKYLSFLTFEYIYNGGGVGIGDLNQDGLADIYLCGNMVRDRLFFNQGGMKFKDVTIQSGIENRGGWSSGVSIVDINKDGYLDIYVCKTLYDDSAEIRENELYINQGDGTFTEEASKYGLNNPWRTQQAVFFDYDLDDDLDVFIVNQPPNPGILSPLHGYDWLDPKFGCQLFQNNNNFFDEVTTDANVSSRGYALGASVADINNDGWLDLFVATDYDGPDLLYMNQKDGTFENTINQSMMHISTYSMGVDINDINNDGLMDILVLDMSAEDNYRTKANMSGMDPSKFWSVVNAGGHYQYMYNMIHLNQGVNDNNLAIFSEVGQAMGLPSTDWSWSPLIADFDLDGYKDIFVSNGIVKDLRYTDALKKTEEYVRELVAKENNSVDHLSQIIDKVDLQKISSFFPSTKMKNYVFRNEEGISFGNKTNSWGMIDSTFSTGAAVGDLDNDGDLDLVLNNVNDPALIYENLANPEKTNFIKINFVKDGKPHYPIGLKVTIYTDDLRQVQNFNIVKGFYSSSESTIHFGTGNYDMIDSVEIEFPQKKLAKLYEVKANRTWDVDVNTLDIVDNKLDKAPFPFLIDHNPIPFRHQENEYDDFEREVLLPHTLSNLGPALAVADVNGDGFNDVFIGGAKGQSGCLFYQTEDGHFEKTANQFQSKHEDVGAIFFDANNDGFQDLYVVSGGNESSGLDDYYQDNLYINNGDGVFSIRTEALPIITVSGSVAKVSDVDQDGDLDLIIGGRLVPGEYPKPASSLLLFNRFEETGQLKFEDLTLSHAPEFIELGLVTDIGLSDLDEDGDDDLLVVGMWMSPTIFMNSNATFERVECDDLDDLTGWWYTITEHDLDQDGDLDFVLGNLGLNYKYKASADEPFSVYYDDFDGNGKGDIVLSYYNFGKAFPLRGRSCSSQQIPKLATEFPSYNIFASSTIDEVYGEINLENALQYHATTFESILLEHQDGHKFQKHILPVEAQWSNNNDFWVGDLDQDGRKEIIGVQNMFGSEVETPRNDAGKGLLMQATELPFEFYCVPPSESGLFLSEEIKSILPIDDSRTKFVLGVNNSYPKIIEYRNTKWNTHDKSN